MEVAGGRSQHSRPYRRRPPATPARRVRRRHRPGHDHRGRHGRPGDRRVRLHRLLHPAAPGSGRSPRLLHVRRAWGDPVRERGPARLLPVPCGARGLLRAHHAGRPVPGGLAVRSGDAALGRADDAGTHLPDQRRVAWRSPAEPVARADHGERRGEAAHRRRDPVRGRQLPGGGGVPATTGILPAEARAGAGPGPGRSRRLGAGSAAGHGVPADRPHAPHHGGLAASDDRAGALGGALRFRRPGAGDGGPGSGDGGPAAGALPRRDVPGRGEVRGTPAGRRDREPDRAAGPGGLPPRWAGTCTSGCCGTGPPRTPT